MAAVISRCIACILCSIISGALYAQVIPLPVRIEPTGTSFTFTANTVICADDAGKEQAALLQQYLPVTVNRMKIVTAQPAANYIGLYIDTTAVKQPEGYALHIDKDHVQLKAHDAAGLVHGVQTLRQLWQTTGGKTIVPGCAIDDYPRFAYRGMALDVSRHLFPVAFIKQYIDLLALYKFNTFHWHLTDDQGWRIEIKRYPKLQSVAAWRKETLIGHKKELPHRFDGKRYGGYYTQAEIKDIVQYAAARSITIIPEIEMPGHALAALSAYPALGCTGGPYAAATFWGVFDDVYCAGNDNTFSFLQGVLEEVLSLFPSHFIHIGGDECPKGKWQACPKCQQRMRQEGLKDEHALQSYFVQRMEKYLNSKGRDIIGWDEILEGGLAPNATVMSWRGEEGGLTAAAQQHRVIMTPESHLYFDYYQSLHPQEPLAAGGYTPLQKVYGYQPARSLPDSLWQYVAGVEGQAWSEYFTSEAQAKYMVFPRAMALAELAWSPVARRDYTDFIVRLRKQRAYRNWSEKVYRPPLTLHKAIGAKVTLTHAPIERFNPGAAVLVNGISGSNRYNDNQWVGTSGEDLEAVIDLDKAQTIRSVTTHVLNYHWQRMWAPVVLEIWVSTDGETFNKVFTQMNFPVNGINTVKTAFKPVSARLVKVKAVSKGIIPAGEYGAGGKALLLMDEIIVN